MSRLVVVSNRIAAIEGKKESAGGLAVGIMDSLKDQGGLWFGWNGKISEEDEPLEKNQQDNITFAAFSLKQSEYDQYYLNFSNTVIWPAFHYRLDLVQYQREDYDGYCRVNEMLAGRLKPLVNEDDILWIHDYHLLPFAAACRKLGMKNRIGFFLHIPFPTSEIFNALPPRKELLEKLCEYDLVGFQAESDRQAFIENLALVTTVEDLDDDRIKAYNKLVTARVYPIGVEPESIRELAEGPLPPKLAHLRDKMNGQLIISVDRLDYSKGLPERFQAYETLLENYPQHRGNIRYFQIAPTSRGDVQAYQDIRHELETEAGRINGHFSTLEWTPLFYLNQHYERSLLMKIFRHCEVGLVTPLRDGMNLVAKEYVASQNPNDPGVLILSHFAGAANELTSALLVNPYDRDGVASALDKALSMPLSERKARYQEMIAVIKQNDIVHWCQSFLDDLKKIPSKAEIVGQAVSGATR
ncbi:Alpha,alpha-trehalose-phosphate synthase [UDP-forming] [Sodalis glossinidius str. 'morsitans']|uniref:Trehalose-6-phosphate synthase n=2 Tax=Sodalis glossinidius (strain morsitans) TaxID=343509 RepID=OTSA_SODGM|nr:alpha,alpha-trehalose-phosphate synthase [Sodalis glossinidius]Q2NTK9.1 RecName: Full=Trehalose-6-phosphate synthase; Short=TPS; AltName: Full=Alpha,alpha-trehalose-phosphate synthase [UDP-forming]; AltName: Full=Osmoregulatory trehalose synthesis protein A; Short=OtsA; AltName: Full=UDP-glucose-glucosephosphate glucosyltransferase [Sodalis glossinidius str. 'morsitans']BAE74516.1 trehalose-6-phosphate synthase [Sodalis glossinidius str. 'morsitans']CRL45231.1 Alpha,alpha-trehalose-phosphate 